MTNLSNGNAIGVNNGIKIGGIPKTNGAPKINGLVSVQNTLQIPTTSNGLATTVDIGLTHPVPVRIKKPPFAFRILNQLNALMGRKNDHFDLAYTASGTTAVDPTRFQQSVTRNLAFPSTSSFTSVQKKKQKNLGEFYNNSTLTWVAKLFSVCVILCAIFMMIRELLYGKSR